MPRRWRWAARFRSLPPKISTRAAYTFTNGTACLLIAMDMDSAKAANQKLAAEGAGFLEKHNAVYLMDVHTMPAVGQFFALRKMREIPATHRAD